MNQEVKKKWIEALRSGKYKQGQNYLKKKDKYCCLGVLCDLYSKETNKAEFSNNGLSEEHFDNEYAVLSESVCDWAEVDDPNIEFKDGHGEQSSISYLNDSGKTFEEIANIIEQKL